MADQSRDLIITGHGDKTNLNRGIPEDGLYCDGIWGRLSGIE